MRVTQCQLSKEDKYLHTHAFASAAAALLLLLPGRCSAVQSVGCLWYTLQHLAVQQALW
jgi:hypothetical protein